MSSVVKAILDKDKQPPIITLVILGFLVFSPFGSILIMDYLGFPISLPELLFLPFIFIFRKKYNFTKIGNKRIIISVIIWIIMISISLLVNRYSPSSIFSSSRSYITLIITYLYFSKENNVDIEDVMYISLGATLGWLYSSLYGVNMYLIGNTDVVSRTGNMLSIPLLISIAAFKNHKKILYFSILLCIAISISSGMRRQILIFVISLFLTYGFFSFRSIKGFIKMTCQVSILSLAFLLVLPSIKQYIEHNIPVLYFRVFEKTEQFLTGNNDASGDSVRFSNMSNMMNNFADYILPKGFISRRTVEDGTGIYIDFPLSELFYMFGAFLATILLFIILYYTFRCFFSYVINNDESVIFVILSITMFILLFVEGTFLSSSYVAPVTGYCLGRLKYFSRVKFKIGYNKKFNPNYA